MTKKFLYLLTTNSNEQIIQLGLLYVLDSLTNNSLRTRSSGISLYHGD